MEENNLIFSISGIRGIFGKNLNKNIIEKIAIAYGKWLEGDTKKVLIGRDTRPSGEIIEKSLIEGLTSTNCEVINLGICPTPIIIYTKNKFNIPGGIVISASHNPPEWNGLKLLSSRTFLSEIELNEIKKILDHVKLNKLKERKTPKISDLKKYNPVQTYIKDLYNFINLNDIQKKNNLRVAIDTGAGTGKLATPHILKDLGCEVKVINNDLTENNKFPREIEPVEKNLEDLKTIVLSENCDVGFAHDCDADRLAIIGNDGTYYPEDIGLALITDHYLNHFKESKKKMIFVTNLASSLIFDVLAERYNAQIIRTPIGERYLAEELDKLITKEKDASIIFGGEGSCGGVMLPQFNNTRDGIFAAAKLIEILVETNEVISNLVMKLPKFYSFREYINIEKRNLRKIREQLKMQLISDGQEVSQIGSDLKYGLGNDWFVLIHPSNTEPILRVISEAKNESLAKNNLINASDRIKSIINKE